MELKNLFFLIAENNGIIGFDT